jgi:hypothetical protein
LVCDDTQSDKASTSLEMRLLKFAEDARAAAGRIKPGREQDVLIQKARKAEAMADAENRLKTLPYETAPAREAS